MATRFGGSSAAQQYKLKQLYIVGGVFVVIIVLVLFLLSGSGSNSAASVQQPTQQAQPALPPVDILVANVRLEQGTQIQDGMVGVQAMPAERVSDKMVKSIDRPTVVGKFVSIPLAPQDPITTDKFVTQLTSAIDIPPGFRAVTITVDKRTGVEGWAKANSRVDILWTFRDRDGSTKVATIVHFTKILSVAGQSGANPEASGAPIGDGTTVTLLVNEKDAKKIELARTLGALTLSLVGDKDPGTKPALEGESITVDDLINNGVPVEKGPEKADGRMYATDPKTGKSVCYVLRTGAWKLCDGGDDEKGK